MTGKTDLERESDALRTPTPPTPKDPHTPESPAEPSSPSPEDGELTRDTETTENGNIRVTYTYHIIDETDSYWESDYTGNIIAEAARQTEAEADEAALGLFHAALLNLTVGMDNPF